MIFLLQPADDETVDPSIELRTDDYKDTGISIQDCRSYGGGYAVNELTYDAKGEVDGGIMHAAEIRSLAKAKQIALKIYEAQRRK